MAYLGENDAQPLLLDGLRTLEYRGYDSSGLAILNGAGLQLEKKKGRIRNLAEALAPNPFGGNLGISHTRWATHGQPTDANAHPHTDRSGRLALVHNGVIENFQRLRQRLKDEGHEFESETDTEVLAHLVGFHYGKLGEGTEERLYKALCTALKEVTGTYGVAVIHADHPGLLIGARRGSPLVLGIGGDEHFLASDVAAVVKHTQKVVYLKDYDVVTIRDDEFDITSLTDVEVDYEISEVDFEHADAELGDFPHYMLKEIYEQPTAIENAFRGRLNLEEATAKLGGLDMLPSELRDVDRIQVVACGTALHSGVIGEYIIEELAHIPVDTDYASEFRYRNCPLDRNTLVLVVSQSGETADTLAALREAQRRGHRALGICNNVGSTIARESDGGVYMHAGPEIGVAATKSFTSQVMIFNLLGLLLGRMRYVTLAQGQEMIEAIRKLPEQITEILKQSDHIRSIAEKYKESRSMLFFGRQYQYGAALEGALKLKEISYIHAEGYPSAELKHGVIALIDEHTPSVFLAPRDSVHDKNVSTLQEIKARQGPVIAVGTEGDDQLVEEANDAILTPQTLEPLQPILSVVPLQLLSYHMAVLLGRDVDKPRNLAKSVTVE
ncbi:MAG: glutamine--fructose-6-phosphate transaminase (isomerizing) [Verrucomicrobiota bacterium]